MNYYPTGVRNHRLNTSDGREQIARKQFLRHYNGGHDGTAVWVAFSVFF
jgi:hypothetical protein